MTTPITAELQAESAAAEGGKVVKKATVLRALALRWKSLDPVAQTAYGPPAPSTTVVLSADDGTHGASLLRQRGADAAAQASTGYDPEPPDDSDELDAMAAFACELAAAAGPEIVRRFRCNVTCVPTTKVTEHDHHDVGYSDIVTEADLEAERVMRGLIDARFPDHAIIGEEFGTKGDPETSEWCWVLDPIDGTRDYTLGTHTWGTLIGLTRHRRPVVGIVDQPCTKERWVGVIGRVTTYNGQPCRTACCAELDAARANVSGSGVACSRDPFYTRAAFAVANTCMNTGFGGPNAYSYGLVASGCIDVVMDAPDSGLYDVCAAIPVVVGAGGVVVRYADGVLDEAELSPTLKLPSMDPGLPYPILVLSDARLRPAMTEIVTKALVDPAADWNQ